MRRRREENPSARDERDEELKKAIMRARKRKGRKLYGAKKMWRELNRDGIEVARCTVERYRLHDLLRSYAAELARHTDSTRERITALSRMLRWYGEQAAQASRALFPRLPASDLFAATGSAAMADPAQAIDWYETELDALRAAVGQAARLDLHDIVAQIATAMWAFFTRTPHLDDRVAITEVGVASARALGDDAVLSWLLSSLGQGYAYQERFAEARACLTEALEIRRRTGDTAGEAAALNTLGIMAGIQRRFEESLEYMRSALAIVSADGEPQLTGAFLHNIGRALRHLERYDEALDHLTRALVIRQEIGDKHAEGMTENTIAETYLALGRSEESLEHYQRSWAALQGSSRDNVDHADALYGMGAALANLDRDDQARQAWQAAIPILDRLGDPRAAELRSRLTDSSGTSEAAFVIPSRHDDQLGDTTGTGSPKVAWPVLALCPGRTSRAPAGNQ